MMLFDVVRFVLGGLLAVAVVLFVASFVVVVWKETSDV